MYVLYLSSLWPLQTETSAIGKFVASSFRTIPPPLNTSELYKDLWIVQYDQKITESTFCLKTGK